MDYTDGSIHWCYQRYLAHGEADKLLEKMCAADAWPGKRPGKVELVEVFISKSVWFKSYTPLFPQVKNYHDLLLWLEEDCYALLDVEVWGYEQATYDFNDLWTFLKRGGPAIVKNESEEEVPKKRKGKDRDRGEDESDKRRKGSRSRRLYRHM
jgi:hypothetical protein